MQLLPPLLIDSMRWRLPMAERSAAALARALLAGDAVDAAEPLAEALRRDPPFAVWSLHQAGRDGAVPSEIGGLAKWLAGRVAELFDEPAESDGRLPDDLTRRWSGCVERTVALAELAAALAVDDVAESESAYLAALVHGPAVWLDPVVCGVSPDTPLPRPEQLVPEPESGVAGRLAEAAALLDDEASKNSSDERIARAARRAAAAARDWAESTVRVPLAEAVAATARLRALETRFDQTLEAEKLEAMAEFAAGAGHEINNPLAVIAGRAQLLVRDEPDPERRRTLALMNTQAKRVYEMIADMMLFARAPEPAFESVEMVALVDHVIEELAPRMTEQVIELRRTGVDDPLTIEADPTQLTVALRAMCQNSMEAIGHDGHIEIELKQTDGSAVIRVRDDGPGISDEARRHLFDPYYSERQAGRGLGLGLSKCWRIVVTNHGGSIDVESQPGGRTVFTITLPLRQDSVSSATL